MFRAAFVGRSRELEVLDNLWATPKATLLILYGRRRVGKTRLLTHWLKNHPISNVVVSDRAAVSACQRFIDDHRVVVEPACGASLAAVYEGAPALEAFKTVMVVVCGGVTATTEQLQQWSA